MLQLMKNQTSPGNVMRIDCAAHLLVFVLCCLDTLIDEVKYCILLNYHFMLLMIIGRRAWRIVITFIYNWLMCIVDNLCSFLKKGEKVLDFNLKDFVMFLYRFRARKEKRREDNRERKARWKDRDSWIRQAEIMS